MNEDEREEREDLARYYEALTPAERRDQVLLQPAYREQYNELTQAHRTVQQPEYFWDRWVSILGPTAACLYMRLRQLSFQNAGAPDARAECWPTQEELAALIGFKKRDTIRPALQALERYGFIERDGSFASDKSGRIARGPDRYLVFFEIPLTPSDAAEMLIRSTSPNARKTGIPDCPQNGHSVTDCPQNGHSDQVVSDQGDEPNARKTGNRPNARKSGSNVNVNVTDKSRSTFSCPEIGQSDIDLVMELVEALGDDRSRRFYRRIVSRLPENLIRRALSEARAARAEGALRGTIAAYFTGTVKRLAAEEGHRL